MWKFESVKDGEVSYNLLEQDMHSDVARFMPEVLGLTRDDIKVFLLDDNAYYELKKLAVNKDGTANENYTVVHEASGNMVLKEVVNEVVGDIVITVVAVKKEWHELYAFDQTLNKDVYLITNDEA